MTASNGALDSAAGITVVSASAGSGKTYRLTQEVTGALDPQRVAGSAISLEGLVAVTFTRKASAELAARIRHTLGRAGAYEEAMRLPLAYLGTVHQACLRLLQELALDAGLSPNVDVVAESQSRLLRQALESALDLKQRETIQELVSRVELRLDNKNKRTDWVTPVADIMELARSNRIAPGDLPGMAERSIEGLLALLPAPLGSDPSGAELEAKLDAEIARALRLFARKADATKTTKEAVQKIEDIQRRRADGDYLWSDWVKLAGVSPAKKSEDCVFELKQVAAGYERHPRLRDDLRELTVALFEAARVGLTAYEEWKTRRRVVDFVDMLDRALDLVEHPSVRDELARRLELVVVDEFQDTSPIQLALFVKLHALAKRSVWVGDQKQCIFEYAGADPALMDDVAAWVERSGGARDRLETNRRSRRELVELSNELFGAALARHGITREEVVVKAHRGPVEGLPPLGVWLLETSKLEEDACAIADGVRRLLADSAATQVVDRVTGRPRGVRPGDVAVLVTTNACARAVANALHARGIRAAIARAGLLSTPEGTLVDAALRWTLDGADTLAAATIDALTAYGGATPDAWLEGVLRGHPVDESSGWRAALAAVRADLVVRSPSEALDAVIDALDAVHLCARWPDAPQRIANVDALRALAATYEQRCEQEREAATIAGLLRYFDDLREEKLLRDEMLASDDQHVPNDDGAVVVCTYHKSKGLEWPVVVLANLDKPERRNAFAVAPETDATEFDPEEPLRGRWIRYWPWPFGAQKTVPLADQAAQSAVGRGVAQREEKERARLLYVGVTRARDHLVLAARLTKKKDATETAWLDDLSADDGTPLVELPVTAADGEVANVKVAGRLEVEARVLRVSPSPSEASEAARAADRAAPRWFARAAEAERVVAPAYWIKPSAAEDGSGEGGAARVGTVERLGSAIVVDGKGYDYDVLGNAVHGFLAADVEGLSLEERVARATRWLAATNLQANVRAESLVRAGEELRAWVERKWPGARWRREIAVDAFVVENGLERRVNGIVDLLLETDEGVVVVDHKTFPGATEAAWRARCGAFAPQLEAYARVIATAEGKRVRGCWVHLPVGGAVVEVW